MTFSRTCTCSTRRLLDAAQRLHKLALLAPEPRAPADADARVLL
jgi:hypothetical protein